MEALDKNSFKTSKLEAGVNKIFFSDCSIFKRVTTSLRSDTGTDALGLLIVHSNGSKWERVIGDGLIRVGWFGAKVSKDSTLEIRMALDALLDGDTLSLDNKSYSVYEMISGSSGKEDAIVLSEALYLSNKKDITIKDGTIYVKNISVSKTRFNYPSTFTIDGCKNITLINVNLQSKGENWGNAGASKNLDVEKRRVFLAQNGGSAFVAVRSKGLRVFDCNFTLAGSVGSFYVSSCADVKIYNTFSSPKSLGYAAFAFDSWCGNVTISRFEKHDASLFNCSTNADGEEYGSKGGVVTEDRDVVVNVIGGMYEDCYANGASHNIGNAFAANVSTVVVDGAMVKNVASVGRSGHSAYGSCRLTVNNVIASEVRTAVHIQDRNSFGEGFVDYNNCNVRFSKVGKAWGEFELSMKAVVANMKAASLIEIDFNNCNVDGADVLVINNMAVYGGLKVKGGSYKLNDYLIRSQGWGGSVADRGRGIEIIDADIKILSLDNKNKINFYKNKSDENAYTYMYINISSSTRVKSSSFRDFGLFNDVSRGRLTDLNNESAELIGCYSLKAYNGTRKSGFEVIAKNGFAHEFYKITVKCINNRLPKVGNLFILDNYNIARFEGQVNPPVIVGDAIHYDMFISAKNKISINNGISIGNYYSWVG